ncbi:hypothetical protein BG015_011558 [Linnemannia schmuckeri]|uniref:Oxidoreductase FAD/NAD(P)-binding domain-containing protein n=1 Tax=Linnemannia schmuckeri TaxID=64567 RepID=A0A9P5RSW4_9FUNG|nr:hypothetical protein BG015_011558 [Linnemannia schmuckeri]
MSNSAVAKWLEEIAAAKAKKAQAKEQQQQNQQQQQQQQEQFTTPTEGLQQQSQQIATAQYGIIPSYNLQTRKKQLCLVLPPEPRKPEPGECCGNDCEPCVNTIYWEDLVAHRERCRKLQMQFEDACRVLEDSENRGLESGSGVGGSVGKMEEGGEEERGEEEGEGEELEDKVELNIRSYRPFKVLQKRYLSENTLLVVCDLPYYSSSKKKMDPHIIMFHLLIRFQQPDGQYLTKAFTPVDISRLHKATWRSVQGQSNTSGDLGAVDGQGFEDRMAFLVKLYPSPHATSDMFRALEVYTESGGIGGDDVTNGDNSRNRKGVLFLRGPIQTGRDRQRNQQQQINNLATGLSQRKRIVMIAAGSGITPMYQVLRALHSQQHHQQHQYTPGVEQEERKKEDVRFWEANEVDLVYCNRTTEDIWLRQELQSIGVSRTEEEGEGAKDQKSEEGILEKAAELSLSLVRRTTVRIQHVLSSASTFSSPSSVKQVPPIQGGSHQFHTGRISLDLLRNTLQQGQDSHDHLRDNKEQLQILVCGPPLFNKDVSAMLTLLNYHDSDTCEIHILE